MTRSLLSFNIYHEPINYGITSEPKGMDKEEHRNNLT